MTQTTETPLATFIVRLADNKYKLGRRFSEWANGAPTLEASVAAAAMTQDELGHARSLYAALQSLPDSPAAYADEERRENFLSHPRLEQPFAGWPDFVAASALFDRALMLVFEAAGESNHEPLRQRAAKILQEEHFHRLYGDGWMKRLASVSATTRAAMQTAAEQWWAAAQDWLRSAYGDELVADGVLAESAAAVRVRWAAEARALLADCGLEAPHD